MGLERLALQPAQGLDWAEPPIVVAQARAVTPEEVQARPME